MSLGDQFKDIIQQKMSSLPVKEIGKVFIDKTLSDTRRGVRPSGKEFPPYSEFTDKDGPVTMRDRSRSIETLDQQARNLETELFFSGNAGKTGTRSAKPAGEVFDMHQDGRARGGKVRKVFPEPEDYNTAGFKLALDEVEQILEEHFND